MVQFAMRLPGKLQAALDRVSGRRLVAVSLAATALTALLMAFIAPPLFHGIQRYDDIVAGDIAFANAYKHGDIIVSFLTLLLFFALWWTMALVAARYATAPRESVSLPQTGANWLPQLIFCFFSGVVLLKNDASYLEISVLLVLTTACYLAAKLQGGKGAASWQFSLLCGMVTAGGFFFSAAAFAVGIKFFFSEQLLASFPVQLPLYAGGVGLLATFLCFRLAQRSSLQVVYGAQFFLPLLLLAPFTRVYRFGPEITPNLAPVAARSVAIVIVVIALAVNLWLIERKVSAGSVKPRDLILLPSVIAVAAFMAYGTPAYLDTDQFHSGELLLTWQQIFEKGQMPFSGFAIARGLGNAVPGLLNVALFQGTYASFSFAESLYSALVAAVNAVLYCGVIGSGWGIVFALIASAQGSHFLTVFLLLVQPKLLARPLLWLFFWLLLAPLFCLYHTTAGIALAGGSFPLAAWVFYVALRDGLFAKAWRERRAQVLCGVAIVAAVLVSIAPLLIAWVGYVLEQGQVNEVAHGTTLLRDTIIPAWFRLRSHWSWEVYRVGGWMAGCFMLWHLFIRERSHRVAEQGSNAIGTLQAVALVAIASTMMSIPYCMGRIDSKSLSRTGAVTTTVIGIMLPLVLLLKKRGQLVPATLIALFLMGLGGAPYFQSPSQLAAKAVAAVQVPKDAQWVNGRSMGLPKFGNTFADQQTLESVRVIKAATDKMLRPGETYLDLTNHVGYYYLLDYKVPAVYAGYYTVVSEQIQNKVIRELQKNPPPLVWTGPVRSFGTGTASIRSYRLYRWLLQNGYVPAQMQEMSFLVRADRYREVFSTPPSEAVQVQQLAETFENGFLAGIPLAWGSNMERLSPRFQRGSTTLLQTSLKQWMIQLREGDPPQPVVTVGLECSEPVMGGKNDFLLLTVSGAKGPLQVRASWSESANGFAVERSLSFDARADTPLLVPLGSHPDWLMSRGIRKLSLDIIGMDQPDVYLREPPVFLSLVK